MFERGLKDLIAEFVSVAAALGGVVAHVFEYGHEAHACLLTELLLAYQLLQQRVLDRLLRVAPQIILAATPGAGQGQGLGQGTLSRGSVKKC